MAKNFKELSKGVSKRGILRALDEMAEMDLEPIDYVALELAKQLIQQEIEEEDIPEQYSEAWDKTGDF